MNCGHRPAYMCVCVHARTTVSLVQFQAPRFLSDTFQSEALWFFFGQNGSDKDMNGRPEHTDQIAHSGTWHLQVRILVERLMKLNIAQE